jgi:glutathione synthase/RimK-type ligase-like ATP-grasp enzyme
MSYLQSPAIGVFYEHPEWFRPMFAEFERRGVAYERLLAHEHRFDPAERESRYSLVLNRMSPSAFTRGHANAIFYTLEYLVYLKDIGANVLNGYDAYVYEFSKARQLSLMTDLGVRYPKARVINHALQASKAAEGLTFPVIVKPNIGGSGAGIQKFDTPEELKEAAEQGSIELGLDHTALVQEHLPARNAEIVRVEVLNGEFLYAIKLHLESPTSFNLCPADYCRVPDVGEAGTNSGVSGRGSLVEGYTPPQEAITTVQRLMRAANIEVGGVEYLINDRDGEIYYYDINALSNFVADAPNVVGFDPFPKLVDFVLERAGLTEAVS